MPRIAFVLFAASLFAQTPALRFEVASIKPNTSNSTYSRTNSDRGILFIENNTLLTIIRQAYAVREFAIVAPAWLSGERFDVTARFPESTTRDDRRVMMQTLLAERFDLQVHRETREMQGFALTVAKKGPKIQPVEDKGDRNANTGNGRFLMEQRPMDEVASQLTNVLGQPVQNETKLKGIYTFSLTYSPDRGIGDSNADPMGPSIFTALEEQLGLRLVARRVPVEVIVVDRCDRMPGEN